MQTLGVVAHVADQNALILLCSEIRLPMWFPSTNFPSLAFDNPARTCPTAGVARGAHDFRAYSSRTTCVSGPDYCGALSLM